MGEKFLACSYPVAVCGCSGKQVGGDNVVFEEADCCVLDVGAFVNPVKRSLAVSDKLLEGPTGRMGLAEDNASEDIGDVAAWLVYGFVDPGDDAGGGGIRHSCRFGLASIRRTGSGTGE